MYCSFNDSYKCKLLAGASEKVVTMIVLTKFDSRAPVLELYAIFSIC